MLTFAALVLEAIVPVGVVETDREDGVAGEGQPVAAGCQPDHAVARRVAAGAADDHPWRDLMFVLEQPQMAAIFLREAFCGGAERVGGALGHVDLAEVRRFPGLDLGGSDMDPQIRAQLLLDPFDQQPADMVHVHMRQHDIRDRCEVDTGSGKALDQLPCLGQVEVRTSPRPASTRMV